MSAQPNVRRVTTAPDDTASRRLGALASAWRRRRGRAVAALAIAVLAAAGIGAWDAGASRLATTVIALAGAAVVLGLGMRRLKRRRIDAAAAARHLDRAHPTLGDSTDLLLADPAALPPLARLQRSRTARALAALEPIASLPDRAAGRLLAGAGLLVALAVALLLVPPSATRRVTQAIAHGGAAETAPTVLDVTVTVTPPAYTGVRAAVQRGWELDVPEGSAVTWQVRLSRAAPGADIVTTRGDTIPLVGDDPTRVAATLRADRSALYQLVLPRASAGAAADAPFHRLGVRPDAAPSVRITAPSEAHTTLAASGSLRVHVSALADDDYGIADAHLVATVASGSGEAVKFRARDLAFTERVSRGRAGGGAALVLGATLDLRALGLGPGDQLYLYVVARDDRTPSPNQGRSETVFIELPDTAQAARAEFAGLAARLPTTYLRSQRQIILDTERLLREGARLSQADFAARSNEIGADQSALRTRYGELTGAESESEAGGDATGAAALTHEHYAAENATLLPDTVKTTLTRAVAAMWDAERRLRTGQPAAALPFEHRALAALKLAQQATRAYVQRVGFESPPLEPERTRLTGNLSAVPNRERSATTPDTLPSPDTRAALAAIRSAAGGRTPGTRDVAALEAAGGELARRAADEPALLPALGALRRLATAWAGGRACPGCAAAAERGLWRALPPADPGLASGEGPASEAARRYFDRLRRQSPTAP